MKKFTKGCLVTALVLFIMGCLICAVCGVLGGYRQITAGVLNNINGIPFACEWQEDGGFNLGFFKYDWEDDVSWERGEWQEADTSGTMQKLAVTEDTLWELDVEVTDCSLTIEESSDDSVWLAVDGSRSKTYYQIEKEAGNKNILSIRKKGYRRNGIQYDGISDDIRLYMPRGCNLHEISIMMGAGEMKTIPLTADELEINVGAGNCEAQGFEAETIELLVGAGRISTTGLKAKKAVMEIGVGELTVSEIDVQGQTEIELDLGNADITGTLTGETDAECNLGELRFHLTGSEEDYGFDVECGVGEIKIGNNSYSGIASSRSWNQDRRNQFELDCDLGSIIVTFDK